MIYNTDDLDRLHDVIVDLTGESKDYDELAIMINELPNHIKLMIEEYGMNDTEVRETIRSHYANE